ncbi:uncharacterized protein LOC119999145 [Tripterygium wilfordii]|uniref:uncharacterized protein LOC119999145 n=1 Tax=Tripterygium wilfordii TaxID=458696 RepID=UPI0018F84634|nr:uncharacterized protein LOC119999145 [Tripterygium wilfordii]
MKDPKTQHDKIEWIPCTVDKAWFAEAIQPDKWLRDLHLDIATYHIRRRLAKYPAIFKRKAAVLDTIFFSKIGITYNVFKEDPGNWVDSDTLFTDYVVDTSPPEGVPWGEVDYVYFPANFDEKHWVAVEMILSSRKINVYDSYHDLTSAERFVEIMSPLSIMTPYILRPCGYDIPTTPWEVEKVNPCPQQKSGGGDCGVFTFKFIEALIAEIPITEINQNDMTFYRKKFTAESWGGEFSL